MRRDAGPYIRETTALAHGSGRKVRSEGENRHLLAGMVSAAPGGIIAMIGGHDDEITRL